jgi:branched-chain amino acid transport system substrate-binding protein
MSIRRDRRRTLGQLAAGLGAAAFPAMWLHAATSDSKDGKSAAGKSPAAKAPAAAKAAPPPPAPVDTGPIRIGVLYPLSGPLARGGNSMAIGARIAAEQFNRTGGIMGRKIELVLRDDKSNAAEAAGLGSDMLGSGIRFIVGGYLTATGLAVISQIKDNQGLFVATGAQTMSITHEAFSKAAFRAQSNIRMNMFAVAQAVAQEHPDIVRWGGVAPDNAVGTENYRIFGMALKHAFQKKWKKDVTVAAPVLLPVASNDYKEHVKRLNSSTVDGLFTGLVGTDYLTFMKHAKDGGLHYQIKVWADIGQGLGVAEGLAANMPRDNFWMPLPWYPQAKDQNAVGKQLQNDYTAMAKELRPESRADSSRMDAAVHNGHVGMTALLTAIRDAKSLEPPAVRDKLEQVKFESASGPFRFRREDHQAIQNVVVVKLTQKNSDPGWEVTKALTIKGDDIVEAATPGQKHDEKPG